MDCSRVLSVPFLNGLSKYFHFVKSLLHQNMLSEAHETFIFFNILVILCIVPVLLTSSLRRTYHVSHRHIQVGGLERGLHYLSIGPNPIEKGSELAEYHAYVAEHVEILGNSATSNANL